MLALMTTMKTLSMVLLGCS